MDIKSDKIKNSGIAKFFRKMWKSVQDNKVIYTNLMISAVLITLVMVFNRAEQWILLAAIGLPIGISIMAEDFDTEASMMLYNAGIVILTVIWFFTASVKTETARMDLKPFIEEVKANTDGDSFVINMTPPFEKNVKVYFNENHAFDKLFASKETFNDFNITAVKECGKKRFGGVDCDTVMEITHKHSGEILDDVSLTNSVYPKKLAIENES